MGGDRGRAEDREPGLGGGEKGGVGRRKNRKVGWGGVCTRVFDS